MHWNGGPRDHSRMLRYLSIFLVATLAACGETPPAQAPLSMHDLAQQGETEQLLQLIDPEHPVDHRDVCARTPLMLAAQYGHRDTVTQLLAAGAGVDLREHGEYTALMLAAGSGHVEVVRQLAAAGAAIDQVETTRGWTALIWASVNGHRETVQALLELGADRRVRDRDGRTAQDWAAAWVIRKSPPCCDGCSVVADRFADHFAHAQAASGSDVGRPVRGVAR